mmetsp:Transcript_14833/g.25730  ORF Transcript_14833/g.25730 Transcript_14833/m.25730 type:complete len:100 (-) Transcript_14833:1726-2025(-)
MVTLLSSCILAQIWEICSLLFTKLSYPTIPNNNAINPQDILWECQLSVPSTNQQTDTESLSTSSNDNQGLQEIAMLVWGYEVRITRQRISVANFARTEW